MKKGEKLDLGSVLRAWQAPAPRTGADAFARDFKARASLMRQEPRAVESSQPARWFAWDWRYAAATATAVCIMVGFVIWPAHVALVTQIKSLQVFAPHSGVIIMTDENEAGTVVWVTDLESDDGNKG